MLYCVSSAEYPVQYISSGNLVSEDGFLHPNRNLDSWVFIVVQKGTLHIAQNEQKLEIHENETVLLFPHQTHYGYKKCEGYLSYYWVHFFITDPRYTIYNKNTLLRHERFCMTFYPPPEKIFCQLTSTLFFLSMAGFLRKNAPFFCSLSYWICPSATITDPRGDAATR